MNIKQEIIRSFRIPFIPEVEAVIGNNISNDFRRHIHDTYIIGVVNQGDRIISLSDCTVSISEGELFLIHPGQVHSCKPKSSARHSYMLLSIPSSTVQSIASQITEKHEECPEFSCVQIKDKEASQKMIKLFSSIIQKTNESGIQIESLFYDFISYLLISYSKEQFSIPSIHNQHESIVRACRYISENYGNNLSLKEIASVACLSPFHFQREFKKDRGITPHEYLNDVRIRESQRLLLKEMDLKEIAYRLGFSDQSHFTRIFRKTVGVTPKNYRLNNYENEVE